MKTTTLILMAVLSLTGCKTVHYQRAEVLNRQNNISTLKERIDLAAANDVDVLAPEHFAKAKAELESALKEAQKSEDPQAGNHIAERGLNAITSAEEVAREARVILADAMQKRDRAQEVHAHLLFENDFSVLDRELKEAGHALEGGNKKLGFEKNADLARRYGQLEVLALKANISEIAEKAYEQAKEANADRLAPLTLKAAKSELDIARKIIEVEKENYDKAQFHAEQARYLAMRAKFIAETLVGIKKEKLTDEEIILWYQSQLDQVHKGLPTAIKFDRSNSDVVEQFAAELNRLSGNLKVLETKTLTKEAHFQEISQMFSEDEAEVLRRGDDLIIRVHGFYFPVGKSELLSRNFGLLNKIVKAIGKFPKSDIEVEGHTDSSGSKKINMRLSEERAQNIADFLIKVSNIDASRVKYVGVGDERPVSSNETQEGRGKNRRIEVIIKNAK